jgi:hypothetical protein
MLTGSDPRLHGTWEFWGVLPPPPRCTLCNALSGGMASTRSTQLQPQGDCSSRQAMTGGAVDDRWGCTQGSGS